VTFDCWLYFFWSDNISSLWPLSIVSNLFRVFVFLTLLNVFVFLTLFGVFGFQTLFGVLGFWVFFGEGRAVPDEVVFGLAVVAAFRHRALNAFRGKVVGKLAAIVTPATLKFGFQTFKVKCETCDCVYSIDGLPWPILELFQYRMKNKI